MNAKRWIAALTLVLTTAGAAGAVATSHGVAGSEGIWPKVSTSMVQL